MQQRPRPHHPRPRPGAGVDAPARAVAEPTVAPVAPIGAVEAAPELPAGEARTGAAIRVPGLLAALRRDPSLARRASVGAIAAGAALFVVAALTTPLAGADDAGRRPVAAPKTSADPVVVEATTPAPSSSAEAIRAVDKKKSATKAPVDHGAISALSANGIPKVALNAYRVAAARMANVDPGCGIDWSLIAGIGREESDHGRFAGSVLHADGTSTPAIVGPALTGKVWEYFGASPEYIPVTGDTKYAHALGPMQFIPTTWAGYGADATGDGKADVFNINDAALGTARYLCAAGGDLTTKAGRVKAVLAYNHNDQYLAQVLALADAYKAGVPITGIPLGITTGKLPKVKSGPVPVANPGAPTAADPKHAKKKSPTHSASPTPRKSSAEPTSGATKSSGGKSSPKPTPSKSSTPKPSPSPSKSGSSSPSASPTKALKSCTPGEKILDNLLPKKQRKCAP